MRVISIATDSYTLNALRLVRSLKRTHPDCKVTIYAESSVSATQFQACGASLKVLPEIRLLGVKRAKFFAYADAARDGGFIYLDADVLVLQPLSDLIDVDLFTACRDDLSECSFIEDSNRPWSNHPEWTAENYFNSGVFAVPAGFDKFFERLRTEASDDQDWLSAIVPGKLYDNHYLCGKLVQHGISVEFVSEYSYNWQGFRRFNQINCYVNEDGELCSMSDGSLLRLVHFAGVRDIDSYITGLPAEVSRALARAVGGGDFGVLETMSAVIGSHSAVDERLRLQLLRAMSILPTTDLYSPGADVPLLNEAAAVTSIALSTLSCDFLWNGLKCGASYLSAAEYKRLRDFVRNNNVEAVLEFGAGYTTVLFKNIAKRQVALEGWAGPWLDFAHDNGCDARIVPFSEAAGFARESLERAIGDAFLDVGKTMVFIDSPPGTANRSVVIDQVVRHAAHATYYVVHDSVRDSQNVYRLAAELGLRVIDHFPSWRGLTVLGRETVPSLELKQWIDSEAVREIKFSVRALGSVVGEAGGVRLYIELKNVGDVVIPTGGEHALHFSLHLIGADGQLLAWDTPRYVLPVDLSPGDAASFWVMLPAEHGALAAVECDFVKEGEFWWSGMTNTSCPKIIIN